MCLKRRVLWLQSQPGFHPDIHTYTACDGHIVCFQQLAAVNLHLQQPYPM